MTVIKLLLATGVLVSSVTGILFRPAQDIEPDVQVTPDALVDDMSEGLVDETLQWGDDFQHREYVENELYKKDLPRFVIIGTQKSGTTFWRSTFFKHDKLTTVCQSKHASLEGGYLMSRLSPRIN